MRAFGRAATRVRAALPMFIGLVLVSGACSGSPATLPPLSTTPSSDTASSVGVTATAPSTEPSSELSTEPSTDTAPVTTDTTASTDQPAPAWSVDTSACPDAAAVNAPITGTLNIGTVAPQTGGLVSAIYAPVVQGFSAYIAQANAKQLLGDVQLNLVTA